MAVLSEDKIVAIQSHMLHEPKALNIKYKARNNQFETISVLHNEVEAYEKMGFSEVKKSARKTVLSKKKSIDVLFEDEVWCMFYNLGFRILNRDEKLSVQWGPNDADKQQLDVVAVGDEAIFVVECKAAEKATVHSFKDELNNLVQYMDGVSESLRQIYGKEKRVKFIFATHNYRFSETSEDIIRMNNHEIFHLNDNAFDYIKNLIKSYKEKTAIYQFMGLMFKNKKICDKPIVIPALKGKMGGKDYFLFSIEPSTLLKIGFVLHRTKVNDSLAPTYQRLLVPTRLKGLTKFIDDGGYFPNSIILNFAEPNPQIKIHFDSIHKEESSDSEFGLLSIPNAYGIAYIIDGQHRIYGYANSKFKDIHTIPVVAFLNMPSEEQLKIFMEINENQKAVKPSLRLDLEQDLYWESDRLDSRMKALRSSIIKELSNNSNNVLYNCISIGEDSAMLTFKPFDTALGRSGLIPKASGSQWTGDNDICIFNTNETDIGKAMKKARKDIVQFINGAYCVADKCMSDEVKSDYLLSNRATFAFITVIGSLHKYLVKTGVLNPASTVQERISAIEPYIETLSNQLSNLSDEENRTIKGVLGQGADTYWLRSYQNIINKNYPDYCPEELIEWKETQDQTLQSEGQKRKADIKGQLRILIFDRLQKAYGVKWENQTAVLKNAKEGEIIKLYADTEDFSLSDYDWKDYLDISDYMEIIKKNFSHPMFEQVFAIDLGLGFKSKKEKIAWLSLVIEAKKKTAAITRSDLNRLELINTHLSQFMPED